MLTPAAASALLSTCRLLPRQHADALPDPAPNPLTPKADNYWFKVDSAGSTVTKQLDVLANDTEGQAPGTELQIMGLDTSAPLAGTPSISADRKSITYT